MMKAPLVKMEQEAAGFKSWYAGYTATAYAATLAKRMGVTPEEDEAARQAIKPRGGKFEPLRLVPDAGAGAAAAFALSVIAMAAVCTKEGRKPEFRVACLVQKPGGGRALRVCDCTCDQGTLRVRQVNMWTLQGRGWTDVTIADGAAVVCSPLRGVVSVNMDDGQCRVILGADDCKGPVGIEWSADQNRFLVTCQCAALTGVMEITKGPAGWVARRVIGLAARRQASDDGSGSLESAKFRKPTRLACSGTGFFVVN